MPLRLLDRLTAAKQTFFAEADVSTLAAPSASLIEALIGVPTASGVAVTRERAIRCVSYLSAVKMLASDAAKMPICLDQSTVKNGLHITVEAKNDPLYPLLKFAPNPWMTSYELIWANVFHLLTQGNFYCQKIEDGLGNLLSLTPINPWCVFPEWDFTDPLNPKRTYRYEENGKKRIFQPEEIWTCSLMAMNGIDGQAIIALGKDALSMMIASDEAAGRFFANGLAMHGFLTNQSNDMPIDEIEAQKVVDRLKKSFTGSSKAGKFTFLPGNMKYEKMQFTAMESQLLESRKWHAEEIARLLGGQPLITKLGYGEKNSTYASSAAFLEEYFSTSLMPLTENIKQTITRDLIPRKQWGILCADFDSDVITRGSPKERAEIDEINIRSGKKSPQECRQADGLDDIEGADYLHINPTAILKDGEILTVGVRGVGNQDEPGVPGAAPPEQAPAVPTPAPNARLKAMATNAADRVCRKESKGGKIDAEFIADAMSISVSKAEEYLAKRKSGEIKDSDTQAALIALATNEEGDQK